MKELKKVISILVITTMLFSLIACTKNNDSGEDTKDEGLVKEEVVTEDKTTEVPKEPAKISIMIEGDNTPKSDNMVIQELEKRTNTDLEIIYVPFKDVATKRSTMVASGDLPDIFLVEGSEAMEYIDAGLIADVSEYLEKDGANIMANVGDIIYNSPMNKDGVYLIPNGNVAYANNLNIRTDWLKNLGMEMPKDLESLYNVMHAFTFDDPDKDGQQDTFGLAANSDFLAFDSIFGAYGIPAGATSAIELPDGTVTTWVKHENFMNAMTYIKKLIDDGLVEPEWATITKMDMFGKLWTGQAGAMSFQCAGPTNNWMPSRYTENPVPTFDFGIITGPDGTHGVNANYAKVNKGYLISADCEDIEAAIRVADYCFSEEGNELLYFGVEGVMFNWIDEANGKYEYVGEYTDSATHRANGGFVYAEFMKPNNNCEIRTMNEQSRMGTQLAYEEMLPSVNIIETLETRADYGADLDQIIKEMYAAMLTSKDDMKAIYDEYIERWNSEGGLEYEEEATAAWKGQNNK
jgi:putative aldouronate transport system substrate-binding protein